MWVSPPATECVLEQGEVSTGGQIQVWGRVADSMACFKLLLHITSTKSEKSDDTCVVVINFEMELCQDLWPNRGSMTLWRTVWPNFSIVYWYRGVQSLQLHQNRTCDMLEKGIQSRLTFKTSWRNNFQSTSSTLVSYYLCLYQETRRPCRAMRWNLFLLSVLHTAFWCPWNTSRKSLQ